MLKIIDGKVEVIVRLRSKASRDWGKAEAERMRKAGADATYHERKAGLGIEGYVLRDPGYLWRTAEYAKKLGGTAYKSFRHDNREYFNSELAKVRR